MEPKKAENPEKHACTEKETLERISIVLFGNGHIEDGLHFMFRESLKSDQETKKEITEIKEGIKILSEKHDQTYKAAIQTQVLLDQYKSDEIKFEEGKAAIIKLGEKTRKEKHERLRTLLQLLGLIVAVAMFALGYRNVMTKQDKVINQVDNLGTPVLSNPRGLYITPEDSLGVKFWPKDYE